MKYKITLNGRTYEVVVEQGEAIVENEYDYVPPAAPAAPAVAAAAAPVAPAVSAGSQVAAGTRVDAPLPGNVLDVKVAVGDAVKAGQVLVIIEAMKMENEVAAPCDGVVKQIVSAKGAVVATGDALLVI